MKRSVLAACTLLAVALLPGCSVGSGVAGELEELPGVRAATVHKQALDTDYYGYTAVVDMEKGASAAEIAGALDGLARWFKGRGGDDGVRLYLGAGTVKVDDGGWGDGAHHEGPTAVIATAGSHATNLANADLLLHATDVLDAPVTIRGYEWAVTTKDPASMLRRVAKDRELAATPGLSLAYPEDRLGDFSWQRATLFSSTEPLTPTHLAAYDKAIANARLVEKGRAHVSFVGSETGVDPSPTDKYPGAIMIQMSLQLPGMAGPKQLAVDPLDDPRWPVVAAQLDLLRTLPEGSELSVDLEWGRAPEGGAGHFRWLVDVTNGGRLGQKPLWNRTAAAYLAR